MKTQNITTYERRKLKVRRKILQNLKFLRLSVNRSNKYLFAQIIDDVKRKTLVSVSEKELEKDPKGTKLERAKKLGTLISQKAKKQKISAIVFDRGGRKYHGRIMGFANAAREGGLQF